MVALNPNSKLTLESRQPGDKAISSRRYSYLQDRIDCAFAGGGRTVGRHELRGCAVGEGVGARGGVGNDQGVGRAGPPCC